MVNSCLFCGQACLNKFCSHNCCEKFAYHNNPEVRARVKRNSKKSINKHKDNPAWRAAQVERFKVWRANNLEKHNAQMRVIQHKTYQACRDKHICYKCQKRKTLQTYCKECRDILNYNKRKKYGAE